MTAIEKARREKLRWQILNMLYKNRPHTTHEKFLYDVMRVIWPDVTIIELRCELDYLRGRKLVDIEKSPSGTWCADPTRYGVDLAEYTIECEPGIARPEKTWNL